MTLDHLNGIITGLLVVAFTYGILVAADRSRK
jgi:hypothetical protein